MPARQDRRQSKPDRTFRHEPHRRLHLRARSRILSLRKANDTCQPARRRLQSHLQADTHTPRPTRCRTQYEGRQRHQVGGRHRVQRLVPFTKYSISTKYLVNADGAIFYADGRKLPSYKSARIWLDNILDKADANWNKFQSIPYQAYYSFVVTPFADQLRLVYNNSDGPMFKDVVPEEEFSKIKSMQPGESVRYSLVLANIHKKGLQKLEFAVEKQ